MSIEQLPVISLRKLATDNPDVGERETELARLRQVTHEIGFFYLEDHGVPEDYVEEYFRVVREFFDLPAEIKHKIRMSNSPHFRGYNDIGGEYTQGKVDHREQIDFGPERPAEEATPERPWAVLEGPNQYPEDAPKVGEFARDWISRMTDIGNQLLSSWAQALGQRPDVFEEAFDKPYPLLKIVRYPGVEEAEQGVGAHKDQGVLTLLLPEPGSTGLQVLSGDTWIEAPAVPGRFVVNIGEQLETATDGYLVATPHRVLPTRPGQNRYSIPFFYTPALDRPFPRLELPAELAAAAPGVGADMDGEEIYALVGRNLLKSRLRAHPDVTERFHRELLVP